MPKLGLRWIGQDQLAAILLGFASLILFLYNIVQPLVPYFDETHYVPAARALLFHSGPVNIEHPLVTKTLIAWGILLFGDNSLGWRIGSAITGAISVVAMFWIGLLTFKNTRIAMCSALLLMFNQTHFIQSRIAMLDMPMTAGILLGAGCFLKADLVENHNKTWEYIGAVALGIAVGAKWVAIPYVALFLIIAAAQKWKASGRDPDQLIGRILPHTFRLGLVVVFVYLTTFWPAFFYAHDPMTLRRLIPFQFDMLASQKAHLATHPYESSWWQWPLMMRPIWYLFQKSGNAYQAVLLIGNPLIYWGGLVAVGAVFSGWMKNRTPALWLLTGVYLFSLLI